MAVGDGRFGFGLVRLVGQKIVVGISNWFYVVFGPLLAPTPNFIQIRWKTQKLKIVIIGRVWLVRLVGKKWLYAFDVHLGFLSLKKSRMGRNIGYQFWCINSFYVVFGTLLAPIPNFIKIWWKTQKLKIFTIGRFWLVRLVGQKMAFQTQSILFLVHYQPQYQISSKSDGKRRSWKFSLLVGFG